MEKQQLKEQVSRLEEELELLANVSARNEAFAVTGEGSFDFSADVRVKEALRELGSLRELVHEQGMQKSLPAADFLQKISSVLIREAQGLGHEVSLSTYGEGRISLEMAEISMGAVLSCVRASLRSYEGMTRSERQRRRLFNTHSIYLEARADDRDVRFRLLDDGLGYPESARHEFEAEKQLQKIRGYIARHGGWFTRESLAETGGRIEFRVPLPLSRFECRVVKKGDFEALLPLACITEVRELPTLEPLTGPLARLTAEAGLELVTTAALGEAAYAVRVGVADFQFWLLCEESERSVIARRHLAGELVEAGCWFGFLGIFHDGNFPQALPLLDGEALMNFYRQAGAIHEGF